MRKNAEISIGVFYATLQISNIHRCRKFQLKIKKKKKQQKHEDDKRE